MVELLVIIKKKKIMKYENKNNRREKRWNNRNSDKFSFHTGEGALQVREVRIDIATDSLGHDMPLRQPSATRDRSKIK